MKALWRLSLVNELGSAKLGAYSKRKTVEKKNKRVCLCTTAISVTY